jgi:uncharacterized membrane-anchored protein
MLDGVKVISKYKDSYNNNTVFAILIAILIVLIIFSLAIGIFSIGYETARPIAVILIALTVIVGAMSHFVYTKTAEYFYVYIVSIDDSVRFNDFYRKYEILEEYTDTMFRIRERGYSK